MTAYTWKGLTRRSVGLPTWVEASYRQGWRHLVVTAADDGREAARIGPAGEGSRTWYAESA
jgi:hypothetical protein